MGPPRTLGRGCASSIRSLAGRANRPSGRLRHQARWSSSSRSVSELAFPEDDGAEPSALRHVHLDASSSNTFPSYSAASDFQALLRQAFLDWKSAPTPRAPSPLVVSFTPAPTYTLGRRQKSLTPEQLGRLRSPLDVYVDVDPAGERATDSNGRAGPQTQRQFTPEVIETERGGLTTYHGPGQVVLWPILDLHSTYYPHLTVRSYARLLEETTQAVLADGPSIQTYLSEEDPGVWAEAARHRTGGQERKIAAMGVHLRRHISGLGTALNVDVAVDGDEASNPWARFVPCGLEGKTATSVRAETGGEAWSRWELAGDGRARRDWYARRWTEELARRLGVRTAPATIHYRLG
ncbi:Putative biotinyl protein ligase (BPL) and lipoyl protein ligase (LPL), catalytic [Colletotrichum destructivum]|uniref:Biotinyl protein ligase (BPL) and lipoyl protein ligase (LPL), catalytic n=1 Tax=Colletotrichum destructivum TaxID=34406 RepID=A0AAX4IHX2_9PEZI|nr:Putative biotinyl protein ligase (BPL) and lipoyl protein ligase (LPL), catalytic [Colletotrichum destructivum]